MIKPPARVQEVFKMQNSKCRMQNYRGTSADFKGIYRNKVSFHLSMLYYFIMNLGKAIEYLQKK